MNMKGDPSYGATRQVIGLINLIYSLARYEPIVRLKLRPQRVFHVKLTPVRQ